jgi:hypothetical protein
MELRPVHRITRWGLITVAILVFFVGIPLFILSTETERLFAWTIKSPLTAAFLGAGYWSAFTPAVLALYQPAWAWVRVTFPGAFVFSTFTAIATFLHLDKFHLQSPASWIWIAVYVVVPPALLVIGIRQARAAGEDPPRELKLPFWSRLILGLQAALTLPLGLDLYWLSPTALSFWPWNLTPLTARVIASALLTIGVTSITMIRENDFKRVRLAAIAYTVYGALQWVNLLRFSNEVHWGLAPSFVYGAFMIVMLLLGAYFWQGASRTPA